MARATHHFSKPVTLKLSPQLASFLWACMQSMVDTTDDHTTLRRAKAIRDRLERQMDSGATESTAKP
jgi:hypothetical protein